MVVAANDFKALIHQNKKQKTLEITLWNQSGQKILISEWFHQPESCLKDPKEIKEFGTDEEIRVTVSDKTLLTGWSMLIEYQLSSEGFFRYQLIRLSESEGKPVLNLYSCRGVLLFSYSCSKCRRFTDKIIEWTQKDKDLGSKLLILDTDKDISNGPILSSILLKRITSAMYPSSIYYLSNGRLMSEPAKIHQNIKAMANTPDPFPENINEIHADPYQSGG